MSSLKILFAAAEATPFSKVGGLADVAGALPKALAQLGHDIRLITPGHSSKEAPKNQPVAEFSVYRTGHQEQVYLRQATLDKRVPVYLVESRRYFERPNIYGEPDDLERYLFFSQVVLETPKRLGWQPDVFHCNDWHTAAIPFGLRNIAWGDSFYASCASVFTIHNLRYRGPDHLTDMMCQGIFYADVVSTVSPNYANEILTPEYGEGLHSLLQLKRDRLFGIINGIDYDEFNPATDPYLASNYDITTLERKADNKAALQAKAGLPINPNVPLIGMVSRLTDQKGFDILASALEPLFDQLDIQFLLLGKGEERYQHLLSGFAERYPDKASVFLSFDLPLAQLIYAGSDIFLMPSRFEPCGLGQLIAMRYGTIPVVRRTGGLADTVQDCGPNLDQGNGFVFEGYTPEALLGAFRRAVAAYHQREAWHRLIERAMGGCFSWEASAREYEKLYQRALELKGTSS